jgi:hypothetical protein
MTPFEIWLENELNVEWQSFANGWFFKWHGMTYEGGVTDVDDFLGGRIHYGGIKFGYQQQQVFWQAVDRYLYQKIHEIYNRWDAETKSYPLDLRKSSLEGMGRNLSKFAARITQKGMETDRALRGRGFPDSVPAYDTAGCRARAEAEIHWLEDAHRALIGKIEEAVPAVPKLSRRHRIEIFLSNNKGILSVIGILVAIILGVLKIWHG